MKPSLYDIPRQKRMLLGIGAAALLSTIVAAACFSLQPVSVLEWRVADFWVQHSHGKRISPEVAVIGITDDFLNEHGWPLEKDIYGDCIDYLTEMGATAIAFDIMFADNLETCGKGDSIFREIIGLSPSVVLGCGARFDDDKATAPSGRIVPLPPRFAIPGAPRWGLPVSGAQLPYKELLDRTGSLGFFNIALPFADGIDRRVPLLAVEDTLVVPSMSLAAVIRGVSDTPVVISKEKRMITVRGNNVPLDRDGYLYVNFLDSIPVYAMGDLRNSHRDWLLGKKPAIGRDELRGRVVFIGNTALSLGDFGVTPLSAGRALEKSPNILMHARSASTLLQGTGLRYHGRVWSLAFSLLMVIAAALLFYFLPAPIAFASAAALYACALTAGWFLFTHGHFLPMLEGISSGVVFCILGSLLAYAEKELNRKYLHSVFGCYLSPHIIEKMYKNESKPALGGEEVHATAFFSDIENFSTFSEAMAPADLVRSLNEYFERMTRILLECNGTLDKYIGDAIVAFFGAPCASSAHAYDACKAAVRMQEALADLRKSWSATATVHDRVKALKMRIGINTGRFVTGNIGCEKRMNYTMIGDAVNLASRLESVAKEYGVYTLVGEDTYREVKNEFRFRQLDRIRVKGRIQPVSAFQLMGMPRETDAQIIDCTDRYERALDLYVNGRFAEAAKLFEQSLKMERFPESKNPSCVMLDRCRRLIVDKPDNWDGVYGMTTK